MNKQPSKSAPVLQGINLARSFGKTQAVRDLTISVRPGELYGVVGPDGAGKTTTIRMLTGLMAPDKGQALVLGRSAMGGKGVREAVGYMPQQYSLYGDLSIQENLQFFGQLFGLGRKVFNERREKLLAITRLAPFSNRRAEALSGGMYKKLALCCALLHQPKVLVLDEPTNGVDPVSRRELWDLLYEFVDQGMAVLLATPYMDEAARCHRVGLIHQGALLTEGNPAALTSEFPHSTYIVRSEKRMELEQKLEERPELLALTPHGANLRVVVEKGTERDFLDWVSHCPLAQDATPVRPDFEDVFLGLLSGDKETKETAMGASA